MQKNDLLTMLDRQSKYWLTPQNIDEKIENELNNLLPPIIASHKDYYNKLVRFSFNIEQGKFEEAEEIQINKKIVEYKNKNLSPLYQELKTIIKYLTINEENSVFQLFKETENRIKSSFQTDNDPELKEFLHRISFDFKKLITLIRMENEKAENKILIIENQIKSLIMILVVWNQYTDLIYKSEMELEEELEESKNISYTTRQRIQGKNLDDLLQENNIEEIKRFYLERITEKKGKGKGLFIKDFLGFYDNPELRSKVDKMEFEQNAKIDSVNYANKKFEEFENENKNINSNEKKNKNDRLNEDKLNEEKSKLNLNQEEEKNLNEEKEKEKEEIKMARIGEEETEKIVNKEKSEKKEKKKNKKKEKIVIESEDLKAKKSKKGFIGHKQRAQLEDQTTEIFEDNSEDEDSENENENENDNEKGKMENKETEETKESKKKKLYEDFENSLNDIGEKDDTPVNEKLKEYYSRLNQEKNENENEENFNIANENISSDTSSELNSNKNILNDNDNNNNNINLYDNEFRSFKEKINQQIIAGFKKDIDCKK
jgi:hypothetical protein